MHKLTNILSRTNLTKENQLHLLSHFSKIDNQYVKWLHEQYNIEQKEVAHFLSISGSKFHYDFVKNPNELFNFIRRNTGLINIYTNNTDKLEFYIDVPEHEYPEGIGSNALISLKNLSGFEKSKVISTDRGRQKVLSIKRPKKPTWRINTIIVFDEKKEPRLQSIFPGTYAPPLPDEDFFTKEQNSQYSEFWNKHVIVL